MLIIEESRDQEQIQQEMMGPSANGTTSRGSGKQQASPGRADEERTEDQYDFSDKQFRQSPQAVIESNASGTMPEDREHFFQIDEADEAAQGGDDFQLDETDFMDPYGNNQDGGYIDD